MIGCLISLIIVAIIALIVLFILEYIIGMFIADQRIIMLVRLLVGLLILLYFLNCIMSSGFSFSGFGSPHYGSR
jgi:Na+-driven multidrug efflux pump